MNKEPSQVKKSKDEILMQVCNITDKEEWSYVEHITPIQALKAMEEYRSQASELPSDDEIESLSVKRYRGEDLDEQKRNSKLILAFEDGLKQMRSIASPLLSSHVARIKELEEEIKQLKLADKVKCDCDENTCCYYCEFEKAGTRNLTMPKD